MKGKFSLLCIAIFSCLHAFCQQTDTIAPNEMIVDGKVYTKVEIEATYPGGREEWTKFLRANISSKVPTRKAPVGTYQVIVRFIVGKDGYLSEVTPETNFGYGMENEVIRLIKKSPKWIPASVNGKPVPAYRRQPVTFVVAAK